MSMITDFAPAHLRTQRNKRSVFGTLMTAFKVMRERTALSQMTEDELADIGLSVEQANREVARPIWDVPANR